MACLTRGRDACTFGSSGSSLYLCPLSRTCRLHPTRSSAQNTGPSSCSSHIQNTSKCWLLFKMCLIRIASQHLSCYSSGLNHRHWKPAVCCTHFYHCPHSTSHRIEASMSHSKQKSNHAILFLKVLQRPSCLLESKPKLLQLLVILRTPPTLPSVPPHVTPASLAFFLTLNTHLPTQGFVPAVPLPGVFPKAQTSSQHVSPCACNTYTLSSTVSSCSAPTVLSVRKITGCVFYSVIPHLHECQAHSRPSMHTCETISLRVGN